jgi:membrane protease YdiL (CAAX protease family)
LNFNRAFLVIALAIFTSQLYSLVLSFAYGTTLEGFSEDYYLYSEIGAIVWYVLVLGIVLWDVRSQALVPANLFKLDFSRLGPYLNTVLGYFGGCAVAVLFLSSLSEGTELGLEYQTTSLRGLSFLTTVILAPIFEELIFRGYLYTSMLTAFKREKERLVVNAMLFAAAHVFLAGFLFGAEIPYYIFVLGYLLAKLYERSRSVLPCILLHALNNGLVFAIDMAKLAMYS